MNFFLVKISLLLTIHNCGQEKLREHGENENIKNSGKFFNVLTKWNYEIKQIIELQRDVML